MLGQEKGHRYSRALRNTQRPTIVGQGTKILFSFAHEVIIFLDYLKYDNALLLKHAHKLYLVFMGLGEASTVELPFSRTL